MRRPSFAIGRVAQGYSQLMHEKGACHLVSPILWLSALARSAWWNGMSHNGDVDGVRLIWISPPPYGPQYQVTVMQLGCDPMSSRRGKRGDPS